MTERDYLDPKGYWGDPTGKIRRMSGEQEIIATVVPDVCSEAEWKALGNIAAPQDSQPVPRNISVMPKQVR
jgi:hypothetical protein